MNMCFSNILSWQSSWPPQVYPLSTEHLNTFPYIIIFTLSSKLFMSRSQCKVCSLHLQEFSVLSVSILFKHSLWHARQCWLERQRQVVFEFKVSLIYRSPQIEFQDNQDYIDKLCLEQSNTQSINKIQVIYIN